MIIVDRDERRTKSPDDWIRFSEEVDGQTIGQIRLMAHTGRADEALRATGVLLEAARQKGWVRRQIKLNILAAIAHRFAGAEAQAMIHLDESLKLAAPGGFIRTFADEGPVVEALLSAYVRGPHSHRLASVAHLQPQRRLLSAICEVMDIEVESASEAASPFSSVIEKELYPLEPFTKKETKILAFLVSYASNEEIASLMHISKDGVKYHIKNIYAKLAVNNRIQAIKIAKRMGLG